MPVSPNLASWLESKGHQAVHVLSLGMGTSSDSEIMRHAQDEASIVITADLDFGYLLANSGAKTPGVILFRGGNYSETEMKELVRRVLDTVNSETLKHAIAVVDKKRIRITRLPLKGYE